MKSFRFYHLTSQDYVNSIKQNGLVIPKWSDTEADRLAIYLFDHLGDALHWKRSGWHGGHNGNLEHRGERFIVAIDLPIDWPRKRDDEDSWPFGEAWFTEQPISTKFISDIWTIKQADLEFISMGLNPNLTKQKVSFRKIERAMLEAGVL